MGRDTTVRGFQDAELPTGRVFPQRGTTHDQGATHSRSRLPTGGGNLGLGDYPNWRGPPPGLLKWSNECEQSIAIRV